MFVFAHRCARLFILCQFLIPSAGAFPLISTDIDGGKWVRADSLAFAPTFYNLSSSDAFFEHAFVEDATHIWSQWAPSPQAPYPEHVLWEWVLPGRQHLKHVTGGSACATLNRLGLKRIMFVGDSLSRQMFRSLLMIIKSDQINVEMETYATSEERNFKGRMRCPNGVVTLMYVGNWHLGAHPKQIGCPFGVCRKWLPTYSESDEATLLVVNTGAHHPSKTTYEHATNIWLQELNASWDALSANRRSNDRIYFRTFVPGHDNCGANALPFVSSDQVSSSSHYNWLLFSSYNQYTAVAIQSLAPNIKNT